MTSHAAMGLPGRHEGYFEPLDAEECRKLLRAGVVGRVGWTSAAGPTVLPVNYSIDGDTIIFSTAPATLLAELSSPLEVAFQVDDFDADAQNGWSVLGRGMSRMVKEAPPSPLPLPWALGDRRLVLAIDVADWSGRAVSSPG